MKGKTNGIMQEIHRLSPREQPGKLKQLGHQTGNYPI
jgi:hypothetical protein